MRAAAKHLSARYPAEVHAVRYPDRGWLVEGFMVWTGPVDGAGDIEWQGPVLYVPVRRRLRIAGRWVGPWREVQSVADAAAEVGAQARGPGRPPPSNARRSTH